MYRQLLILLFLISIISPAEALKLEDGPMNVGDRVKPDVSAIFQVTSTTQGQLGPRMTTAQRDAIATPTGGLEIFNLDTDMKEIFNGISWEAVGGTSSSFIVNQVAHGKTLGCATIPVYLTGGIWTDAKADSDITLATHVIVEVIDVDNFKVAQSGSFECIGHGLVAESHYFVSETVAGGLTLTEPPVFSNPVLFVEDANNIIITNIRASANTGAAGPGSVSSVFGRNGAVVAIVGDYGADQISVTPSGNITSTNVEAALNELDTLKLNSSSSLINISTVSPTGFVVQTSTGNYEGRTLQSGSGRLTIVNPAGISGDPVLDVDESQIDHDALLNFVANEHIDWTAATQTLSTTGGIDSTTMTLTGDLVISGLVDGRDIFLDGTKLDGIEALADVTDAVNVSAAGAIMDLDFSIGGLMTRATSSGEYVSRSIVGANSRVSIVNGNGIAGNPTIDVDETQFDHDNLLNFVANEHIDHSAVFIDVSTVQDGLIGGGDLTATRTLAVDINSQVVEVSPQPLDEFFIFDLSANMLKKTTLGAILNAQTPTGGEANTGSNLGTGSEVFESKVGIDLRFRTLDPTSPRMILTQSPTGVGFDVDEAQLLIQNMGDFDADRYLDHTTVSINTGLGLSGGGDISANRIINFDLPSLVAETAVDGADLVVIFDDSAGVHRKMTRANFVAGITPFPVDSVFGRVGAITAQQGDYTGGQVTFTPVGNLSSTTVSGAIAELDLEKEPIITGAASTATTSNFTADRVVVSTSTGKLDVSAITITELDSLSGVNSNVQTQLNQLETTTVGNFNLATAASLHEFNIIGGTGNVGANNTTPVSMGNNSANGGMTALRNGEIVGISVRINNTRSAGTLTASALINGVVQNGAGEETDIDAVSTQGNFQVIASPILFVAGDNLNMQTLTTGFAPTGSDAVVTIWVKDR